jgi:membrane-associated protein
MDWLMTLFDWVMHIDHYLQVFVQMHGLWVYALLFTIIFVETGVVIMPFLPGDSLLFITGSLCGMGLMDYPLITALLWTAAVLGNQTNFFLGRYFGKKILAWEHKPAWFTSNLARTQDFYDRYGGLTLVFGRFIPFVRTFAPFVAGLAAMDYRRFTFFDILGGGIWVVGLVSVGYLFGNTAWVQANLQLIILALILVPTSLAFAGAIKRRFFSKQALN